MAQLPAVKLFERQAQAVNPIFELTAENIQAVVAICQHAAALRECAGVDNGLTETTADKRLLDQARTHLGDDRYATAWDAGQRYSIQEAMRDWLGAAL